MATKRSKREQATSHTSLTGFGSENEENTIEKTPATKRTLRSHSSSKGAVHRGHGQMNTTAKMRKTESNIGNTMDTDFNFRPKDSETPLNADPHMTAKSIPIESPSQRSSSTNVTPTVVSQSEITPGLTDHNQIPIPINNSTDPYKLEQTDDDPCNLSQKRWYIATPVAESGLSDLTNKEIVNTVNEFFIQHHGTQFIKAIVTRPGEELDEIPKIVVYLTKKDLAEEICNTKLNEFNNSQFVLRPYPKGKKPGANRTRSREEEFQQTRDPERQLLIKNIPLNTTPYEIKMAFHENDKTLVEDVFMLTPDHKGFLRARV
ncbi:hypothetical protein C1645_740063 [Glomus cerebriforme]|uniref:Uncharacterized protein n=1 Tax=Glomus cerebriforme TaxID=658196 RepID=A0A397SX81_9GLOM|nr:hypothetical protein C1645_740063 [Glomus cerebriforme]